MKKLQHNSIADWLSSGKDPPAANSSSRKRKAEEELPVAEEDCVAAISPPSRPAKKPKVNVGGSSRLEWVNILITSNDLDICRENLFRKIRDVEDKLGCLEVRGFTELTRPVMDKNPLATFKKVVPAAPERFSPYVIAMIQGGKRVPSFDPPRYPDELRKVKNKRTSNSKVEDQEATWVASHLCHNRRCCNVDHLVWEPSWMNRLRDNCPGGDECQHGPDKCLRPHRPKGDVVDWTSYLSDEDAAQYWAERDPEDWLEEDF